MGVVTGQLDNAPPPFFCSQWVCKGDGGVIFVACIALLLLDISPTDFGSICDYYCVVTLLRKDCALSELHCPVVFKVFTCWGVPYVFFRAGDTCGSLRDTSSQ